MFEAHDRRHKYISAETDFLSRLSLQFNKKRGLKASLQKLNIPDWYKQYSGTGLNTSVNTSYYKTADVTGLLRQRNSDVGRWQGLSSKTTSLSSLGSNRSDRSPAILSPSAHSHHGGQTGFSRWSTSEFESNISECISTKLICAQYSLQCEHHVRSIGDISRWR